MHPFTKDSTSSYAACVSLVLGRYIVVSNCAVSVSTFVPTTHDHTTARTRQAAVTHRVTRPLRTHGVTAVELAPTAHNRDVARVRDKAHRSADPPLVVA